MLAFTARNLRIFFRDRSAVFFSLLASLIIIGLYILFLGDIWISNMKKLSNAREVMDNWVMAGLLAVTSVTTTMGAFGIMVADRTKKINKDFYCAPVGRRSLAGGYILGSFIIGLVMSLFTLILAEAYIIAEGGSLMTPAALAKVVGLIMLADFSGTSLVFFITSFFSSENAFSTASTVIGTLIGFLTGIYLPIGMLPPAVQWVVKLFPPSHAAVLLRKVMMSAPLAENPIPAESLTGLEKTLGVAFYFGKTELGAAASVIYLLAAGFLFFALAALGLSRKKK